MPVVRVGDVVPGPVGDLEVLEDDAGVLVLLVGLAPDVHLTHRAAGTGPSRFLEPRVLVRRVVADQLVDHAHATPVRLGDELAHVGEPAIHRVDVLVVGDVVAVVAKRGGVEGQQPDRADAELLEVGQLFDQALEVSAPVAVAVVEGPRVDLIDDRVLVPERIVIERERLSLAAFRRFIRLQLIDRFF